MNNRIQEGLKACRRASAPLVVIITQDEPAVLRDIIASAGSEGLLVHDVIRGLTPARKPDESLLAAVCGDRDPSSYSPVEAVEGFAAKAQRGQTLVMVAADRNLERPENGIALMLNRDAMAASGARVVLLVSSWTPTAELGSDAYVINDAPPSYDERRASVERIARDAERSGVKLTDDERDFAARYTRGLSQFGVEQTVSLALSKSGLNRDLIREVWAQAVKSVKGLRVQGDGAIEVRFDDLAGNANIKDFCRDLANCRTRFDAILQLDEFEKLFGSAGKDLSGSTDTILKKFLTTFELRKWQGLILLGPPGTGKSALTSAMGELLGVPVIVGQPEDTKGGLVGDVERDSQRFVDTVDAMGGNILVVATSNEVTEVPDAFLRRFTHNTWFMDLPSREERLPAWNLYGKRYEIDRSIPGNEVPVNDQWYSMADIRNVSRTAYEFRKTLAQVMENYVPVARSRSRNVEQQRRAAVGNYISTSYPGKYRMPGDEPEITTAATGRRALEV